MKKTTKRRNKAYLISRQRDSREAQLYFTGKLKKFAQEEQLGKKPKTMTLDNIPPGTEIYQKSFNPESEDPDSDSDQQKKEEVLKKSEDLLIEKSKLFEKDRQARLSLKRTIIGQMKPIISQEMTHKTQTAIQEANTLQLKPEKIYTQQEIRQLQAQGFDPRYFNTRGHETPLEDNCNTKHCKKQKTVPYTANTAKMGRLELDSRDPKRTKIRPNRKRQPQSQTTRNN
jgi:hypothetical protein